MCIVAFPRDEWSCPLISSALSHIAPAFLGPFFLVYTRLNDSAAGTGKGAKGDHKGAHSAPIPCKHFAKGTCARGDKCRFSHKGLDSKTGGKGSKGKKANIERDRCKEVWKNHENYPSSAQAVLTSTPVPSPSEVAPPGLSTPVNSSANSENVVALATILRGVLSPGGPSESARAARCAALARPAGYVVRQNFLCSLHVIKTNICP